MPGGVATSLCMNPTTLPAARASTTPAGVRAHVGVGGAELTALLAEPGVTLVDFTAAWCAPCQRLTPILAELGGAYAGRARIVAVDVDAEPAIAQGFRVTSMPTMVLVRDGREVGRIVGLRRRDVVAGALDRALEGKVAITG